jgi:hypothetical protein
VANPAAVSFAPGADCDTFVVRPATVPFGNGSTNLRLSTLACALAAKSFQACKCYATGILAPVFLSMAFTQMNEQGWHRDAIGRAEPECETVYTGTRTTIRRCRLTPRASNDALAWSSRAMGIEVQHFSARLSACNVMAACA